MALSFKDYVLISNAMKEIQLEEGKIDDMLAYVKKLLGPKASKEDIEAKMKKLQDADKKDVDAIKKTSASRDFAARRAANAGKPERDIRGTRPTVSTHAGIEDAKKNLAAAHAAGKLRAGQARAADKGWMNEAQDFSVTYTKAGVEKLWKVIARDVAHAKEKFKAAHYGVKLVSVEPIKAKKIS